MAGILRAADLKVEVHDDHFAQDAPDPEWLAAVGKNNWIVITRDERIRYNVWRSRRCATRKVRVEAGSPRRVRPVADVSPAENLDWPLIERG